MVSEHLDGLDTTQVLDAVETWHTTQTEAEIAIFVAAARFADLHHSDTRPAGGPVMPGMEQPKRLGGPGTPLVWEFAVAEFGARLGKSPHGGLALIADALDCRHRLPKFWARVCAGEAPVSRARYVAQQTRHLSAEAAGLVDTAVATDADGRLNWSRFTTRVAAKITEADPDAAAERERLAAEEEFAKLGRGNEHGQKTLYVKSSTSAMTRINATIDYYARILAAMGDGDTLDHRRAKAVLIMANPLQGLQLLQAFATRRTTTNDSSSGNSDSSGSGSGDAGGVVDTWDPVDPQPTLDDTDDEIDDADDADGGGDTGADPAAAFTKPFRPHEVTPDSRFSCGFDPRKLLPTVVVYLHLYARTDTGHVGPVARWEGEGPVTTHYVRDLLGPHATFTIKPVIDLDGQVPVDGYEIPDRLREAVHLRTPADIFPYAANTGRTMQIDHTRAWIPPEDGGPPAQTDMSNLDGLTQFHHRVKTHGAWQVKQPYPGLYLWRDPHSVHYLVDHTGTRRLNTTGPPPLTGGSDYVSDITADIYPADPDCDITHQPNHTA